MLKSVKVATLYTRLTWALAQLRTDNQLAVVYGNLNFPGTTKVVVRIDNGPLGARWLVNEVTIAGDFGEDVYFPDGLHSHPRMLDHIFSIVLERHADFDRSIFRLKVAQRAKFIAQQPTLDFYLTRELRLPSNEATTL